MNEQNMDKSDPNAQARLPALQTSDRPYQQPPSQMATSWLTPTNLESGLKLAELMSKCRLVPTVLQGSISDCLLVLSQAARWGMDPFAVAQATAVVKGKLCFEGKLVAAALVATGAIEGSLDYEFAGEGDNMEITVTGVVRRTGKTKVLKGSVKAWRTNGDGSPWDKDKQSMLVYRGTRQWCRLYCPEVILGVTTPDEVTEREVDATVTGTEGGKPGVVPETKSPKKRAAKETVQEDAAAGAEPAREQAVGTVGASAPVTPAKPDPRLATLLMEADVLAENWGSVAIAELRGINSQMGVTTLRNVPIVKLDEALALVRKVAVKLGGAAAAGGAQ